jgi:iron complex outermembrane recepter protein
MTRSRLRKLRRLAIGSSSATAMLACIPAAYAQQRPDTAVLEEVVVTAQKRSENLQDVPLSIQALGAQKLEDLHVTDFADYVKFLPSVAFQSAGPGYSHAYMRGVAASNNINHSGSLPSVGVYLDEQPITTIDGELDVHIYDIERVEALAGPQGTLYGASSQAGTIRIITNKPDPSGFKAGYDVQGNTVDHGSGGYSAEGFVNLPLNSAAAIRMVGWYEHDAGYINNVAGTVTFPTSGAVSNNAATAKNHYNDVTTEGARAALKIDLDDNWTITPTVMGQLQKTRGSFGFNPQIGDLEVTHFFPEFSRDSWVQSALTVEGKIANFDLVYAGAFLGRSTHTQTDYTDYSFFYDVAYGQYFRDNAGNLINPSQTILGEDHYSKQSHELRISSPTDRRFRFVGGLFFEEQTHNIQQDYFVKNLGSVDPNNYSVTGWPGTLWLTEQTRTDRDYAAFTELNFDITEKLTATGGIRFFKAENSLIGFYGFGKESPLSSHTGEQSPLCNPPNQAVPFKLAPCTDLNDTVSATGNTPKLSLSYKFTKDLMVYATYSKGFRPGGVNRGGGFGGLPPYQPDYLKNYEVGWKTSWNDNRLRFNGAFFLEDWKDFQFSFLGPNSLTIIKNAGQARIKGVEADVEWAVTAGLTLSGGFSLLDAKLRQDYCGEDTCTTPDAPSGTQLPVTPKFKSDLTARYAFSLGTYEAYAQAAVGYVGSRWADLRLSQRAVLGEEAAYTLTDFAFGVEKNSITYELYVKNAFDERAQLDRYAECDANICGQSSTYILTAPPRTIGIKFGQKF